MYNAYFGFTRSPFENNLDQRFTFLSEIHQEVLAALLHFANSKNGFAIVCGDVGTGKTMMINTFLNNLPKSIQPIIMLTPYITSHDILLHIAKALKIKITKHASMLELTDKVKTALISANLRGKNFVLIIDEAHLLSDQALTEIGLLSNIETSEQKLLQILLVGHYGLSHKLDRPEMRHLQRRITVKRFLSPLNPEETIQYVDYRLRQVGSSLTSVFEDKCRSLIVKMTKGYPPLINQLCDNGLLICMAEGLRKVNRKILKKAHEAWQTDLVVPPKFSRALTYRVNKPNKPLMVVAGSLAVLVLVGIIATRSGFSVDNFKSVFQKIRSAVQTVSELPAPLVMKCENLLKPEKESPQLRQSSEPEEAVALSLWPSASAPMPSSLPKGFGRVEIAGELSSGQKQSPSPPGKSEMKPKTARGPQLALGIPTDKETLEPQEARNEVGRGPAPSPGFSPTRVSPASTKLIIRAGDTLSSIVNRHYPGNKKLGQVALILANPELTNANMIYPGQALYLPEINSAKETIRSRDKLFYVVYGRYVNLNSLKKGSSWLEQRKVHFVLRDTKDSSRNVVHHVFLGGYATEAELEKALESVNQKSDKGYKGIGQDKQSAASMNNQAVAFSATAFDKQKASPSVGVTQIHLNKELRNDSGKFKFKDQIDGAFNKFAVVGQTNHAAGVADTQKNVRALSSKDGLIALSEVQLQQVTGWNHIYFHKVYSKSKMENSFNGFIGVGQANQSTGSINNQGNIFSFTGAK
jgi:type II secretory pathway predicted ATPase ExeA